VLLEENKYTKTKHYFVVWDRFDALDQETRSRIVLRAVEDFSFHEALNTTIAMGFTRKEAKELELAFEDA
jgi:hypothetical protein